MDDKKEKNRRADQDRLESGEDPDILSRENSFYPLELLGRLKIVSIGKKVFGSKK